MNPFHESYDQWEAPPLPDQSALSGAETGYLAAPVDQSQHQGLLDPSASLCPDLDHYPLDPVLFPDGNFDTGSSMPVGDFGSGSMAWSA